jgi:hypothetical protein
MANSGTKLHGKNGKILFNGTTVAVKNQWSLNLNRDFVDATVFGDVNKTYLVGLRDISGTYNGLLDNSGDVLLTASANDAGLIELYSDASTLVASGSGFIDASITASNTDAVRISGNFRAQGPWTTI